MFFEREKTKKRELRVTDTLTTENEKWNRVYNDESTRPETARTTQIFFFFCNGSLCFSCNMTDDSSDFRGEVPDAEDLVLSTRELA